MSFTHLEAQHISYYTLFLYPISSESCYLLHLKVVRTLISLQGHQIKVPKILTGNPLINAIQILIFLTSKVSFLVQKLEYRATVITAICHHMTIIGKSDTFVNVHLATSLEIYTCIKLIKFAHAMLNGDICLATVQNKINKP